MAKDIRSVLREDAAFFKHNPDRNFRLRLMALPEIEGMKQKALRDGEAEVLLRPAEMWIVAIQQVAPGIHLSAFLPVDKRAELDQPEDVCRSVFNIWADNRDEFGLIPVLLVPEEPHA